MLLLNIIFCTNASWSDLKILCRRIRCNKRASIILGVFFTAYFGYLGLLWNFLEPSTFFFLSEMDNDTRFWIGGLFYVVPVPIAAIAVYLGRDLIWRARYKREFIRYSERVINAAKLQLTGSNRTLFREEVQKAETVLKSGQNVILVGEGGSGKSGIGVQLALSHDIERLLIIDARWVDHILDANGLAHFFHAKEYLEDVLIKEAACGTFRLVIDQLDNVSEKRVAKVLVKCAVQCARDANIEVLVISRNRETYEKELLSDLIDGGFAEVSCLDLDSSTVIEELGAMGITNPPAQIVTLAQNILNLEIIATMKAENPGLAFDEITDEVDLWDAYFTTVRNREAENSTPREADLMVRRAYELSRQVLASDSLYIDLGKPPLDDPDRKLVSNGILDQIGALRYQFRHERLQDYIYARDAIERDLNPGLVIDEIGEYKSLNAFVWINKMNLRHPAKATATAGDFLEAILNG